MSGKRGTKPSALVWMAAAVGALIPSTAFANSGLPMLFVSMPKLVLAFVPIVLLETWVFGVACKTGFRDSLKPVTVANAASTFVGVPLTWGALVLLTAATGGSSHVAPGWAPIEPFERLLAVTWQAPWLMPYERQFYWMVPAASAVLLIPFGIISVLVEYLAMRRMQPLVPIRLVAIGVAGMNVLSYSLLLAYEVFRFVSAKP